MEWLNKAANNAKAERESVKDSEEKLRKLKESYQDYLMQLWMEFQDVFKEVEEKFGTELTSIKAHANHLVIEIGDVTIDASAEQGALMGGYFAAVYVTYKVPNTSGGPHLPYSKILLTNDGKWVYLDKGSNRTLNKAFGKEQITEIFKTALWKYLK
ncbi:hypothetical protein CON66_00120 [Bacillus cereus]|uniref:hypothetical protein n=1 Tax=Bacillus cereus TaxID=1396 RepID=UPI000BEB698B|nr:hypothetical protein [Bacillus cereus]PEA97932.1 hypothetical protein CON66_00120 [Bacillus cereus]